MRKTHALMQVAIALLNEPNARQWGYDLSRKAGVRTGVLYPILTRMLNEGWMTDGWESREEIDGGRPPRRYYELTNNGRARLGGLLAEARTDARFTHLIPRFGQ